MLLQVQAIEQQWLEGVGELALALEAHRSQARALLQDALHVLAVILVVLVGRLRCVDVGVARDADDVGMLHGVHGKYLFSDHFHHMLKQDEGKTIARQLHNARALARQGDEAEHGSLGADVLRKGGVLRGFFRRLPLAFLAFLSLLLVLAFCLVLGVVGFFVETHDDVERAVFEMREGVAGIDDLRGEERCHVGFGVFCQVGALLIGELIEIEVTAGRRFDLVADTVETGGEHHGFGQIGIGAGIRRAQLNAGRIAAFGGNPHQGTAVPTGPGNIDRRFITGNQSFIGIDHRIGNGGDALGVFQQTAHIIICEFRKTIPAFGIVKYIFSVAIAKTLVHMHTAAGDAVNGFRHKGGVKTVTLGHRANHQFEGLDAVSGGQRFIVFKINFMLARGTFMMGGLDFIAHVFQIIDHFTAGIGSLIHRREVKITGLVVGFQGGAAVAVGTEKEKFRFGADVEGIAHFFGFLQIFP